MPNLQQLAQNSWQFMTGTAVRMTVTAVGTVALVATTVAVNWQTLSQEEDGPDTSIVLAHPEDSSTVTRCLEIVSGHGLIPKGKHLWIAVMPGSSAEGTKRITLVGKGEAVQTSTKGRGQWKAVQVNVGGENRLGYHYRLFAILLSEDIHKMVVNSAVNVTDFNDQILPMPGQARWRIEYAHLPGEWSDPIEVIRNAKKEKACESRTW